MGGRAQASPVVDLAGRSVRGAVAFGSLRARGVPRPPVPWIGWVVALLGVSISGVLMRLVAGALATPAVGGWPPVP